MKCWQNKLRTRRLSQKNAGVMLACAAIFHVMAPATTGEPPSATTRSTLTSSLREAVREASSNGSTEPVNHASSAPAGASSKPPETTAAGGSGDDLRSLIGVNPGLKRAEIPRLPVMSVRGFIQQQGRPTLALLEISELNRVFLVAEGTKIPITVAGRVTPVGRAELTGLGTAKPTGPETGTDAQSQSQIILTVEKVTSEGVTVNAGLLAQTMIIR